MSDIEKAMAQMVKQNAKKQTVAPRDSASKSIEHERLDVPTMINRFDQTGEISQDRFDIELDSGVRTDLSLKRDAVNDEFITAVEPKPEVLARKLSLPTRTFNKLGIIHPKTEKSRLTEEYRRIKRSLLKAIEQNSETTKNSNVLMVTSAVSGEGKTFNAINLAMSIAMERDKTVLLIDADVIKGSLSKLMNVQRKDPGLLDLLIERKNDLSEIILHTDIPNLKFIPAGETDDNTSELLSSDRMKDVIDEISLRYEDRVVIVDCPPILQTNEANIISDYVGQVVFVVAEEDTAKSQVIEAINRIDKSKSLSIILNKSKSKRAKYNNNYEYGYK